ncbi:isochorismate synthase MenF [Actinomycetes bacterium NPDC127524]
MIFLAISQQSELLFGLTEALKKAQETNQNVLFSEVKKIDVINPLSFYQAGRERYAGERFFWQDPAKETTIIGLGKAEKLQGAANAARFKEIESRWSDLLSNAVKIGTADAAATGPLLFGGFSFDYQKSSSMLWDQFGDHLLYIPAFMLSICEGEAYLTANLICSPEDSADHFIDLINEREKYIYENLGRGSFSGNELLSQIEIQPEEWKKTVAEAVEELKETDLDKIVLAREMRLVFQDAIFSEAILERLMAEQTASFIFSLESGSDCFIGATPERLIKKSKSQLYSACLAGTIARGKTEEEDELLGAELLCDQKNLIEHQYVVSMISKAINSVCDRVYIPEKPELMKIRHIQHLYTPVTGECDPAVSVFSVIDKLHPTPALGGLPKEKAVTRIREIELLERGLYAGPIGWADSYGNGEFAVGIRSGLIQGNEASLFAGCGVVEDSTPESEYQETSIKFNPMLSALGGNLHE